MTLLIHTASDIIMYLCLDTFLCQVSEDCFLMNFWLIFVSAESYGQSQGGYGQPQSYDSYGQESSG